MCMFPETNHSSESEMYIGLYCQYYVSLFEYFDMSSTSLSISHDRSGQFYKRARVLAIIVMRLQSSFTSRELKKCQKG